MSTIFHFLILFAFGKIVYSQQSPCYTSHGLSDAQRTEILLIHNTQRQRVANGDSTLLSSANMKQLKWDADIESFAQNQTDSCPQTLNENKSTTKYPSLGEIIHFHWKGQLNITRAVESWFEELAEFTKIAQLTFQTFSKSDYQYLFENLFYEKAAHFTQLIWADTWKLGCGYAANSTLELSILICNYFQAGNILNNPIYRIGLPCDSCPQTCSSDYFGLCDLSLLIPTQCPKGYTLSNITKTCDRMLCLSANCLSCQNNNCNMCSKGYILENNGCRKPRCTANCEQCETDSSCLKCQTNQFMNSTKGCQKCWENCTICLEYDEHSCIDCSQKAQLMKETEELLKGKCVNIESQEELSKLIENVNYTFFANNKTVIRRLSTHFKSLLKNFTLDFRNQTLRSQFTIWFESFKKQIGQFLVPSERIFALLENSETLWDLCTSKSSNDSFFASFLKDCQSLLSQISPQNFTDKIQARSMLTFIGKLLKESQILSDDKDKQNISKIWQEQKKSMWNKSDISNALEEAIEDVQLSLGKSTNFQNSTSFQRKQTKSNTIDITFAKTNETSKDFPSFFEINEYPLVEASTIITAKFPTSIQSQVIEIAPLNKEFSILREYSISNISNQIIFTLQSNITKNNKFHCWFFEESYQAIWKETSEQPSIQQNDSIINVSCSSSHFSFYLITNEDVSNEKSNYNWIIFVSIGGVALIFVSVLSIFVIRKKCKKDEAVSKDSDQLVGMEMNSVSRNAK